MGDTSSATQHGPAEAPPPASAAQPESHVYTVAPYLPFLDAVAQGVLDRVGNDPLKLADYTILVPDRETATALRQAFVRRLQGKIHVMPSISAPGDIDDEELSLRLSGDTTLSKTLMSLPSAVSRLQRQLVLAQEILKIPGTASSTQKAIKLGGELGKLLDDVQRHDAELKDIDQLVPPEFKDQWSKTAEFLKILTDTWPQKLQEMGRIDPEEHRNSVIRVQTAYWQQRKSAYPVMAVGFNDDSAATRDLLQAVAVLPAGTVVLQGLDREMDQHSWDAITPVHPQNALKGILGALGVERAAVNEWPAQPLVADTFARAPNLTRTNQERQKLLREAMRPAGAAEGWTAQLASPPKKTAKKNAKVTPAKGGIDIQALNGMDLITCGTPQEEASVIALKMRESLEGPGRTVTLVTEDRSLARRVSARLRNWQIDVRDDAGMPLSETQAGVYLLATAALAAEELAPVPLLEALKHPLAVMGEDKQNFRRQIADLENMVFHGPRPGVGVEGVREALTDAFNRAARRPKEKQVLTPEQLRVARQELEDLIGKIEAAGKSFLAKMSSAKPVPFLDLLDEHIRFAEALAADGKETGADRIWRGDDGIRAARFLTELRSMAQFVPDVTGKNYVDVLQGLMRDVTVRSKTTSHPSLRITTPERARLLKSDIIILGGINDEVWPPRVNESPWLSPDMMKSLGLPAPEASIGRAAHSFVQLISNPNVLLTRAMRSGDGPSVSSPFLTRLLMILRGSGLEKAIEKKTHLLDVHMAMYTPAHVTPIEPPHVTPPVDKRPKQLPVTAVEMLMRDPYAVYVKYVLKLRQKDPLDASPSVSERGMFAHAALDAFMKQYPDRLPDNAEEELLKIGRDTFKGRMDNPTVRAFWWPRFERIARWFVKFEGERRGMSKALGTEVHGKLEFDTGDGIFTLTTVADRVDRSENDQLSIIDYKTGSVPSQRAVALGFSPQLTLEALIAFSGGLDGIDASDVGKLQYWKLSGGRPAADITEVKGDVKQLVTEARDGVEALIKAFNDPATPYLSMPRPEWAPRHEDAHHLSRVDEWSTVKKTNAAKKVVGRRSMARKRRHK
ncbi:MAG: double-strand break repair protein AddB [Proteobacteria bacterium]|nr:double-strand break repair protein AddB [Pseudomonadota bacterium]